MLDRGPDTETPEKRNAANPKPDPVRRPGAGESPMTFSLLTFRRICTTTSRRTTGGRWRPPANSLSCHASSCSHSRFFGRKRICQGFACSTCQVQPAHRQTSNINTGIPSSFSCHEATAQLAQNIDHPPLILRSGHRRMKTCSRSVPLHSSIAEHSPANTNTVRTDRAEPETRGLRGVGVGLTARREYCVGVDTTASITELWQAITWPSGHCDQKNSVC